MKKYLVIFFLLIIYSTTSFAQKITLEEVKNHVGTGSPITVCGKVYGGKFLESAKNTPTLLDIGANYPDQLLTVVIFGDNLSAFPKSPETYFLNREVCITGVVIDYNGKPEIVLRTPDQIQLSTGAVANSNAPKNETTKVAPPAKTEPQKSSTTAKTEVFKSSPVKILPKESTPTSTSSDNDITLTGDVYMRSGPSFDYPIILTVKSGTLVSVIFSSNGWSQVIIKGANNKDAAEGYIKNSVLK
jgi:uncharacterized protein YgiM (DUF1202 family)